MHLIFSKLTESNLQQISENGYLGEVKKFFEFMSGQGDSLFIDVHMKPALKKDEKDFIFVAACALLTGGSNVKEELSKIAYSSNQILVTFDKYRPGNIEQLFGVDWSSFQPLDTGWLITCNPAEEVEALIFCERKVSRATEKIKAESLLIRH